MIRVGVKLYVGGLDSSVDDNQLSELFSQGGFASVEMSSKKEAKKAIEMLSGKKLKGKAITINEARPRK